jgi:glyoxylase-like metal-dependent hydrolase (beta-lactamase superfamily II)
MKTTKLSRFHFQLTQLGLVNAFLVAEDDGFTLIDTCIKQAAAIMGAAKQLAHPIRRIVLTHAHTDHAGSVDALMTLDPSLQLLLSQREARLLSGDHRLDPDEPALKLRGDYVRSRHIPNRILNAGETVGSLRVIPSPGHTPGHVALLDVRDGTLFAGDAFSLQGGIAVAGDLRPYFPFPALGTWSVDLAIVSAEELCALRPDRLCVGHGNSLADPWKSMKEALRRASTKKSRAVGAGLSIG